MKEVETTNFNHYKKIKKKSYGGGNGANFSCKQGRLKYYFECNSAKHFARDSTGSRNKYNSKIMCCFKCNFAQHFVHDCTGSRNNINSVMESDQVHFAL